jgi:hypothetical protein
MGGYARPGRPTGIKQEIPGDHYRADLLTPERPGEHVWLALAQFRVTAETLRAREPDGGAPFNLDRENLAGIVIGCYVCEQPYTHRLGYRRCPGEPGA